MQDLEEERKNAEYWIEKLSLIAHPEGGYYKETYRSQGLIDAKALPLTYQGQRNYATSIYFLLKAKQCSKLHKIASDEIWYYHAGDAVNIHMIRPKGKYSYFKLGPNLEAGEQFQCTIPNGTWFGATIDNLFGFALFGCMVAPGFNFEDFQLANRNELLEAFPEHKLIITTLT